MKKKKRREFGGCRFSLVSKSDCRLEKEGSSCVFFKTKRIARRMIYSKSVSNLILIHIALKQKARIERQKQRHLQPYASKRCRAGNRVRDREFALKLMSECTDFEFTRMFRMGRAAFGKLLDLIKNDISAKDGRKGGAYSIPNVTKLAATLRWLAGGSYLDISSLFGLDQSNFFNKHGFLWKTIDAIDAALDLGMSFAPDFLARTAAEFAALSRNRMTRCVMAVDGWVCETRQPTKSEVGAETVLTYRNRKSCWGIVCIAGCDARCRFLMMSAKCSGNTHDHVAWDSTTMATLLEAGVLPEEYYFIGDEAFVNTNQFLIPWSGTGLGLWKDSFNYHLSAMRQTIERAFGLLTQRWGIFWRPLRFRFSKWSTVVTVCAKLHNFCIDESCAVPLGAVDDRLTPENIWRVFDNHPSREDDDGGRMFIRPTGAKRRDITTQLEIAGVVRPGHASKNGKA